MTTYYIIHPDEEIHNIWNHRLGSFATDFDAGYRPSEFGYSSFNYAQKRAEAIMHKHEMKSIKVLSRERLFDMLAVEDWSGGY